MLQITPDAATFLSELRRGQEVPETAGLRVFPDATGPGDVTIALGFTDDPIEGDQVTEQEGLRVFVARELTAPLDDAAIDVLQDDGSARIVFRPQGELYS